MRFPKRTLLLMIAAVLAFFWMYSQTHRGASARTSPPIEARLTDGAADR